MNEKEPTRTTGDAPTSEATFCAKLRVLVADKTPDSLFPEIIRAKFTAEKAALAALVIGIAGDLPVFMMVNYLGVFVTIVLSFFGAYLGLYALKIGGALEENNLRFAVLGVALSLLNILLVFFVMLPGIRAAGEFEAAADAATKQLEAMGSMF